MNSDVEVAKNHTSSNRNKQKRRDHNSKTSYLIRTYFMKQCFCNKVSRYNRKSPREKSRSPCGAQLPIAVTNAAPSGGCHSAVVARLCVCLCLCVLSCLNFLSHNNYCTLCVRWRVC
jgi:hypothetical protein